MALAATENGSGPRTKQQYVYHALRDAIMRCELVPGQRITTDDIARRLSVSLIPVREAFRDLQAEGLVTTVPHTGTIVAPISEDSIVETFTVLEGLELAATRVVAERLTAEIEQTLTKIVGLMDAALQAGQFDDWSALNSCFHLDIARFTGMPMLREMTARALAHWDRAHRFYFEGVLSQRMEQSQKEHHEILRALHDRDAGGLELLVKVHNRGALAAYMEYIEAHCDRQRHASDQP